MFNYVLQRNYNKLLYYFGAILFKKAHLNKIVLHLYKMNVSILYIFIYMCGTVRAGFFLKNLMHNT